MMNKSLVFFVFLGIVILNSANLPTHAEDSTYRPGKDNPYESPKQWTLFRDDELAFFQEEVENKRLISQSYWMTSDKQLHHGDESVTENFVHKRETVYSDYGSFQIASDYGRLEQDVDHMVRSYYTEKGTCVVELLDESLTVKKSLVLNDSGDDARFNFTDVSIADLYPAADDNDEYHEEILVARSYRKNQKYYISLLLLDHEFNKMDEITELRFEPETLESGFHPMAVRLESGDFNGDHKLEVIVTFFYYGGGNNRNKFVFCAFGYNHEEKKLGQGPICYGEDIEAPFKYVDTAAGDFNGDGRDDLALFDRSLIFYSADENLNITQKKYHRLPYAGNPLSNFRLVSGLFVWDQDTEYHNARRQLALVYNYNYFNIEVELFTVHGDYSYDRTGGITVGDKYRDGEYRGYDVVAGNFFVEDGDHPKPVEEIAISYIQTFENIQSFGGFRSGEITPYITFFQVKTNDKKGSLEKITTFTGETDSYQNQFDYNRQVTRSTTLCVIDRDGDSLRLGKPVHVEMDNFLTVEVVMQEPPKHVDFLPADPTDWSTGWEVINVNAHPEFCVVFRDEEEVIVETENRSSTSLSLGGSLAVSTEKSWSTNAWIFGGAVTLGFKAKAGYDYTRKKSSWNKNYKSFSREIELETNEDDILYGKHQLIDIWRYPILNEVDDNGRNVYIDCILPGPYEKFAGSGLRYEHYQPTIINRHLLSYPSDDGTFPPDLGTFELPDGTKKKEVMTENTEYAYTGNKADINLEWNESSERGKRKSTTHAMNWSTDIKVAYKGKAKIAKIGGTETKSSVNVNFHGNHSWNDTEISKTETSSTQGVRIENPELPIPNSHWSFAYKPAVYMMADAGGVKAAHAVDFDSLGTLWKQYYGSRPDLSLALPHRFHSFRDSKAKYVKWHLNHENDRMSMRGFFLYNPEPNKESGERVLIARSNINEGDEIDLTVRVYNLCLSQETGPFKVHMEAVKIDTATDFEVGDRIFIGEANVESLDPREVREVGVRWDTTNYGLDVGSNLAYRFYVTLDPENDVEGEIHEWKDEDHINVEGWTDETGRLYHGNNEGYYPETGGFFVHKKNNAKTSRSVSTFAEASSDIPTMELHEQSLAILTDDGLLNEGEIQVPIGKTYKIRLHIQQDKEYDPTHAMVYFHDQHPDSTDEVFDIDRVTGFFADTYIWGFWTPNELGPQEIWAALGNNTNENPARNLHDSLKIVVFDPNVTPVRQWQIFE